MPRVAIVIGLLVLFSVGAAALVGGNNPAPAERDKPEQGAACPYLREAAARFDEGTSAAFTRAVKVAARKAERTLQDAGVVFGRPEELALRLRESLDDGDRDVMQALLVEAEQLCSSIGR